jgi:hypothetical protein
MPLQLPIIRRYVYTSASWAFVRPVKIGTSRAARFLRTGFLDNEISRRDLSMLFGIPRTPPFSTFL